MEIRAYNELYLSHAMENLAAMFDCGINRYGISAPLFFSRFITSGVAAQIENGNPRYLVGLSGWELAERVIGMSGGGLTLQDDGAVCMGRSPEFWAGWVLAYYQWRSNRPFSEMRSNGLDISKVIALYHPLHEADPEKFYVVAEGIVSESLKSRNPLKEARERIGMTQKSLSEMTGVSLRMIRAYEQKKQDMSRAEFATVIRLAKVVKVSPESLLG